MTKRTEKVANGVLSGVVKVSEIFTSKVANSKAGKKFLGLLPGEIVLASLDGFSMLPVLNFSFNIAHSITISIGFDLSFCCF